MKWLRFFFFSTVIALASCASPTAPKYPDPEDEPEPKGTDPGPKSGLLITPSVELSFWV